MKRKASKDEKMIAAILNGEISPELILWGYCRGIFPMGNTETDRIDWYAPDPRAIIDLAKFHLPHTLRPILHKGIFRVTIDHAFHEIIRACSRREETWITEPIINCYCTLHNMGFGHSIEVWNKSELAGGLYGVAIGGAFFGESMFHKQTNASKVALAALVQQMKEQAFELLDIQFITPHLARFGAIDIPRDEYQQRLGRAIVCERNFVRPGQQTIIFQ